MRPSRPDARDGVSVPLFDARCGARRDRGESVARIDLPLAPPRLDTARLRLEPRGPQHAAALFERLRDPELYRFVPVLAPASLESLETRYRRTASGPDDPLERWWNWTVFIRSGDEIAPSAIGTVETTVLTGEDRALIAYTFGRDAWGFGYAFEACAAAIAHVRRTTAVAGIAAFIDTRNTRSISLVERLGLVRKETIENADHFKGLPSHEYRYWTAIRPPAIRSASSSSR